MLQSAYSRFVLVLSLAMIAINVKLQDILVYLNVHHSQTSFWFLFILLHSHSTVLVVFDGALNVK